MGDSQRRVLAALTILAGGTAASLPFYHGSGLRPDPVPEGGAAPPAQTAPVVPLRIVGAKLFEPSQTTSQPSDSLSPYASTTGSSQGKVARGTGPGTSSVASVTVRTAESVDITELPTPSLASRPPDAEEQVPPAASLRRASEPVGPGPDPAETRVRVHRIRDGDTLEGLAERFLGDRSRWREIRDANREILVTDDVLPIGTSLQIPPRLVATSQSAPATEASASPSRPDLVPIEWK